LRALVNGLDDVRFNYYRPQMLEAIYQYTEYRGSPQEIKVQYEKEKNDLYFDTSMKKFRLKGSVKQ